MAEQHCDVGLVGLGVMGRNVVLNMANHGFAVAGYDLDRDKADALNAEKSATDDVTTASGLPEFVQLPKRPRAIVMLVPADKPVDSVTQDLLPHLDPGGCVIRAALLENIRAAYQSRQELPNLLLDPHLTHELTGRQEDWRSAIGTALNLGLPVPGLTASLAYFDAYRSSRLPANLIQAQRDYFGSHTYERIDTEGIFHTHWDNT